MELGIEFSLEYFFSLFNNDLSSLGSFGKKILANEPAVLAENLPTNPVMRRLIDDMLYCPFTGMVKKIFVESKVMELVSLVVHQAKGVITKENGDFRKDDMEKLHMAREIIVQRMHEPCSLMQLARLSGLNDFKLKKGFREVFGTTVFGYLLEERMNLGRRLLIEGQRSILEISQEVGYKNATHFTAAFKRHFGYLPSDVKNIYQ